MIKFKSEGRKVFNDNEFQVIHKSANGKWIEDFSFDNLEDAEEEAIFYSRNNGISKIIDKNGKTVALYKDMFKVKGTLESYERKQNRSRYFEKRDVKRKTIEDKWLMIGDTDHRPYRTVVTNGKYYYATVEDYIDIVEQTGINPIFVRSLPKRATENIFRFTKSNRSENVPLLRLSIEDNGKDFIVKDENGNALKGSKEEFNNLKSWFVATPRKISTFFVPFDERVFLCLEAEGEFGTIMLVGTGAISINNSLESLKKCKTINKHFSEMRKAKLFNKKSEALSSKINLDDLLKNISEYALGIGLYGLESSGICDLFLEACERLGLDCENLSEVEQELVDDEAEKLEHENIDCCNRIRESINRIDNNISEAQKDRLEKELSELKCDGEKLINDPLTYIKCVVAEYVLAENDRPLEEFEFAIENALAEEDED